MGKEQEARFLSTSHSLFGVAVLILLVVGCAKTQIVKVNSSPSGADVIVKTLRTVRTPAERRMPKGRSKREAVVETRLAGITPVTVELGKLDPNLSFQLSKNGYEMAEVDIQRSINGPKIVGYVAAAAVGAFLLPSIQTGPHEPPLVASAIGFAAGSGLGLLIGLATGDIYKLSPAEVNVVMKKKEQEDKPRRRSKE